jgi:diguanylate cyclase (GGDEF)-like protein
MGLGRAGGRPQFRPSHRFVMTPTLVLSPAPAQAPAEPALAAAELRALWADLLPAVLQRGGELLAVKDLQTQRYVHVNAAMADFLRRPLARVIDHSDAELFDAGLVTALRAAEQTALAQGTALTSDHRFEWDGVRRDFSVLRVAVGGPLGGPVGASVAANNSPRWLCSVWTDLAPQRQRDAQLQQALLQLEQQQRTNDLLRREMSDQGLRDPASGLYRRAHFEDQLRREVDLSTREHREFAVVFIEVDPLAAKVVALGESGHQRTLEALGRLLRSGTRAMDASCRYDDKRFAVLLSGVGLATAHARMEGLRRKCASEIVVYEGQELGFSVAMGVASFPHTAQTQDGLLVACEAALAEAQRRGGNHVALAAIRFESN